MVATFRRVRYQQGHIIDSEAVNHCLQRRFLHDKMQIDNTDDLQTDHLQNNDCKMQ